MKNDHTYSSDKQVDKLPNLANIHQDYVELSINTQRFKHHTIDSLIRLYAKTFEQIQFIHEGNSFENRSIHKLQLGEGSTSVLMWSQMHGNEPTATMALFDIINFLMADTHPEFNDLRKSILSSLQIHMIPMLNPDGAERFRRRTAQGVDMNRDALRLQTPEGQILKRVRDELNAEYAFNLHDQSRYYRVGNTDKAASISVLAPAYNEVKEVNKRRENAIKVIASFNKVLQQMIPGHVGRYDDTFEPRAFGDNIAKWGSSTILIESGGYKDDPEKQFIRKLNFVAILSALYSIASQEFEQHEISEYYSIPENDDNYLQLKIKNLSIDAVNNPSYRLDIGFQHQEINIENANDYYRKALIEDVGDLSTWTAYHELDATGLRLINGKVFEKELDPKKISTDAILKKLSKGYLYFPIRNLDISSTKLPAILFDQSKDVQIPEILPNQTLSFCLVDDQGQIRYVVLNGFLINAINPKWPEYANGLIIR